MKNISQDDNWSDDATNNIHINSDTTQLANNFNGSQSNEADSLHSQSIKNKGVAHFLSFGQKFKPDSSKKLVGLTVVVLFLLVLSAVLVSLQQNSNSETLYNRASEDIKNGQYATAGTLLSSASKKYSFPGTHHKILTLASQDKTWILDEGYLNQATTLVNMKSFNTATTLLQKIGKDFPSYQKVLALLKVITADKQLLAASEQPPKTQVAHSNQPAQNKLNVTNQPQISNESSIPGTPNVSSPNTIPVYANYGYNFYYAGARQAVSTAGATVTFRLNNQLLHNQATARTIQIWNLRLRTITTARLRLAGWLINHNSVTRYRICLCTTLVTMKQPVTMAVVLCKYLVRILPAKH